MAGTFAAASWLALQPTLLTFSPFGVSGHWSMPSQTPSPSASDWQPVASTMQPFGVLLQ